MSRTVVAALAATLLAAAGCGSDGPDTAVGAGTTSTDAAAAAATVVTAPGTPDDDGALDGITGELVLTRQRDLLDRGLINVMVDNASDRDLIVADRALEADHFAAPPTTRTTKIGAGRRVALQTPYGVAVDCDDTAAVTARLVFDDGETLRRLELAGTELLDELRAEQCVGRALTGAVSIEFRDVTIVDGAVEATLHAELTDPQASFELGRATGTILVAARRPDETPVVVDGEHPSVELAVTFTVNRCDPHAVAEVTKPYGLDLEVSRGDGEPVVVGVDVTSLEAQLAAIVDECRAASTE